MLLIEGLGGSLITEGFLSGKLDAAAFALKKVGRAFVEAAQGSTGGGNRDFTLSGSYIRGSVALFLNGVALLKDSPEGWEELGANRIRMNRAPESGDVVHAFFRPL